MGPGMQRRQALLASLHDITTLSQQIFEPRLRSLPGIPCWTADNAEIKA